MNENIYSDELYHYGRKGMKWGQHIFGKERSSGTKRKKPAGIFDRLKSRGSDNKATGTKSASKSSIKSAKKKKSIAEMTDDELRSRISRLELEKRYRDLSPKQVHRGRDFVTSVLENSARNVATQTTTYAMGTMINRLAVAMGSDDPHIINPKKGQKDK